MNIILLKKDLLSFRNININFSYTTISQKTFYRKISTIIEVQVIKTKRRSTGKIFIGETFRRIFLYLYAIIFRLQTCVHYI